MSKTRRETFRDIVRGASQTPYLVGGWQHLVGHEYGAQEFAEAYIEFVHRWDWEWVKINPRAVYYAEAWGSRYDSHDYAANAPLPKKISSAIVRPADVANIDELDPAQNASFVEAFDAASLIRDGLEDRAVVQTVFSPLSVLLQIADLPLYPGDAYATPQISVEDAVLNQPEVAKQALGNIARTLAGYARRLVRPKAQGGAGLDGIFYAVTGTVSEGYFDADRYREFSEPYDRLVIDAVHDENPDAVVLLHTCRAESHPEWFDVDGVDLLHWDRYLPGNPKEDSAFNAVPVAGPNWELFANGSGEEEQVRKEITQTVAQHQGRPFLLAPSCTVPTPANDNALRALSDARIA